MSTPLLFWSLVFGTFVVILTVRVIVALIHHFHGVRHLFKVGSEREIVYVPGDPLHPDVYDFDDNEDV